MAKFDPPPKFTFKPTEWLEWIEEFGRFLTATTLHKEDSDVQKNHSRRFSHTKHVRCMSQTVGVNPYWSKYTHILNPTVREDI